MLKVSVSDIQVILTCTWHCLVVIGCPVVVVITCAFNRPLRVGKAVVWTTVAFLVARTPFEIILLTS